ncbi:phage major capsid protein [Clostridium botulinum]|uniref:phage major capsid protein n=1 Tax=Clostridium botulinum TaxID=1491 RepID=UPI0019670C08|nr:phage major capsid protein [Clostridium botulinum]MBN1043728.1 phage major capsid protein [Clostridium botulinum]
MNKELRELLDQINNKKEEVKNLANENKIEEAKAAKDELIKLQDRFNVMYDLDDESKQNIKDGIDKGEVHPINDKNSTKEFANAARNGFKINNQMSEGSKVDGGYTVPEDIQTKIEKYREAKFSLIDLVSVEPVTTQKGSRTYKKRSQQTGFAKVGEGSKIGGKNTPQFERISYEIEDYAGYFPVTNDLLEDSDSNLVGILVEWIGDESRVTRNKIILDILNGKDKTELTNTDDIKKALNVTLGAAFKNTSSIVTNDDGFQWLDTLKDNEGKYLLQPMITDSSKYKLFNKEVKVVPNSDMPSDISTNGKRKIPFIIGDLKEGVKFYDRKKTTITSSNIAVAGDLNAFEQNLTLWRAIEREDCKIKDSEAFVNGILTIEDKSVVVK